MKNRGSDRVHTHSANVSPCVRNCCLDDNDVCIGCGRTLEEIRSWSVVDDETRLRIRVQADERVRERRLRFPM